MAIDYSALNPFIFSETELLAAYRTAFTLWQQGKTIMEFDGKGTSFSYMFTSATPEQIMNVCNYCLRAQNPTKYGYIVDSKKVLRI